MKSLIRTSLVAASISLAISFPGANVAHAQSPAITVQPADNTVFIGQNAGFSATATGAAPLSFHWYREGDSITNATNSTLNLANVQAVQAGSYQLIVANASGSATSSVATLTVIGGQAFLRLLEFTNTWIYNASGSNMGTAWRAPVYNDSSWATGRGILALTPFVLPEPMNSALLLSNSRGAITTFYFRAHFNLPAGHPGLVLVASNLLDDGAVFYLNGAEAARVRLSGTVTVNTF